MDSGILTSVILPLLNGTDKKKIKDSIVKHIVSNPQDFIDDSFTIEVEDLLDRASMKQAISESLNDAIVGSKAFGKSLLGQVTECVKDEINNIYEDGELLNRDNVSTVISDVVVTSLKSSLNI